MDYGVEVALCEWLKVLNVRFGIQVDYSIHALCISRVSPLMGSVSDIPHSTNTASNMKHIQLTQHSMTMCKHADCCRTSTTLKLHNCTYAFFFFLSKRIYLGQKYERH